MESPPAFIIRPRIFLLKNESRASQILKRNGSWGYWMLTPNSPLVQQTFTPKA